jgi:hypothetical protein
MSNIDNGGPAFPLNHEIPHPKGLRYDVHWDGMTLRDWFAGQALIGLLGTYTTDLVAWEKVSARAYGIADAMIEARKVQP